jgi:hypothetical protein
MPEAISFLFIVAFLDFVPCYVFASADALRGSRRLNGRGSGAATERALDLAIRLVLAEREHRPDGGRDLADQGDLQKQTDDSGDRTADREELEPRNDDGEKEAHCASFEGSLRPL